MPLLTSPSREVLSSSQRTHSRILGRSVAARIIISKISGKDENTSPVRIITASTCLPKYPEINPRVMPITSPPVAITTNVMMTVFWIPHSTRVKTSRPFRSVPSKCSRLGGLRMAV